MYNKNEKKKKQERIKYNIVKIKSSYSNGVYVYHDFVCVYVTFAYVHAHTYKPVNSEVSTPARSRREVLCSRVCRASCVYLLVLFTSAYKATLTQHTHTHIQINFSFAFSFVATAKK